MKNYESELSGFESFFKSYFSSSHFNAGENQLGKKQLYSSMRYSLFGGGKRFRPLLSLLTSKLFSVYPERIFPFAASIECIHTYSLIHDDLPCMDNDDFRRGRPTNHKVYEEDIALLAGDALISEAFVILGQHYNYNPALALKLTQLLAQAIGPQGMVAGQALDLRSKNADEALMNYIHSLKTGALIEASVTGVGIIAGCHQDGLNSLKSYGRLVGQAFQLADDLHDAAEGADLDEASMLLVHSRRDVQELLEAKTKEAIQALQPFGPVSQDLIDLANYNLKRTF